ncbi:MAG: prepilin-type N-terminal cleavage/methylation domain-containing protein [Candidatus Omnitrophota bacterium]
MKKIKRILKGSKKNSGYTLVEMLVSMGIYAVIVGSLFTLLISQNTFITNNTARMDVDLNARKAMIIMVKELRMSKKDLCFIYDKPIDQLGAAITFQGPSIVFQVPVDWDGDGNVFDNFGRIEWGIDGKLDYNVEYCIIAGDTEGRLWRRVWDDSNKLVSSTEIARGLANFWVEGLYWDTGGKKYAQALSGSAVEIFDITIRTEKNTVRGRNLASPLRLTLTNRVSTRNN